MRSLLIYLASTGAALAHEGHPGAGEGTSHWLTMPDHLIVVGLAGALLGAVVVPLLRRLHRAGPGEGAP